MYSKILKYKNKYVGEKVLFLGTGTSLLDFDLEKINDTNIYTFAFNRFIPFYKEFWPNLKLDFYMCHDPTVMNTSFYNQFQMRKIEGDEGFDLKNINVQKYKNTSTIDFIFENKIYLNTKIIFPLNLDTSHANKFNLSHNRNWAKKSECETENFLPYYSINKKILIEENNSSLQIGTWAKNSFINSALPILSFLGFSKIYLCGVDYSNKGFFFSKSKNHTGFFDREFKEFKEIMNIFNKKEIFSIFHKDTQICAKDNFVEFEEFLNE